MATIFLTKNRLFLLVQGEDKNAPTPEPVVQLLTPLLTYVAKVQESAEYGRKQVTRAEVRQLFSFDFRKRLVTFFGTFSDVKRTLMQAGYKVVFRDLNPEKDKRVFQPRWDLLNSVGVTLRPSQEKFMLELLSNRCGRFSCPTGWGKSFSIFVLATLLPKARILVTSYSASVIDKTIYTDLLLNGIDVGLITSKRKTRPARVMCVSSGCLHKVGDEFDILIADEAHELATDTRITPLTRFGRARLFGFSASHGDRVDGCDARLAALFGPMRIAITYDEAVRENAVIPIRVIAREVTMPTDPAKDLKGRQRLPLSIWGNHYRNMLIAEDARSYPDEMVLISCTTLEHVLHLSKLLPEALLVYSAAPLQPKRFRKLWRAGLIDESWKPMTESRLSWLFNYMAKGPKKIFIASPVVSVGVNLKPLSVLIRADAQASAIKSTQIPGRTSRKHGEKKFGIVRDYFDKFAEPERGSWYRRRSTYLRHGWDVTVLDERGRAISGGSHYEDSEDGQTVQPNRRI